GKVSVQVRSHQVYRSSVSLIEDLSVTFESLILLLPSTQVRVLECLALDPTDSPHANEYLKKHNLSRGGTLQGALLSLEQKGLVYGPDRGYKIALPMLGLWLRYRLG
ncbi:MAG: ATP-binding protein, partial [Alkalinema sp. CAN_BIN05]|nr:ATP-binding protein [Alkalinema sp. CAN_BIN05]